MGRGVEKERRIEDGERSGEGENGGWGGRGDREWGRRRGRITNVGGEREVDSWIGRTCVWWRVMCNTSLNTGSCIPQLTAATLHTSKAVW